MDERLVNMWMDMIMEWSYYKLPKGYHQRKNYSHSLTINSSLWTFPSLHLFLIASKTNEAQLLKSKSILKILNLTQREEGGIQFRISLETRGLTILQEFHLQYVDETVMVPFLSLGFLAARAYDNFHLSQGAHARVLSPDIGYPLC